LIPFLVFFREFLVMPLIAVEIEGPVNGPIVLNQGGSSVLNVLGKSVVVDPNVAFVSAAQPGSVSTPTAKLTLAQLADPTPFPGRTQAGFDGAVVIVKGHFDPSTGTISVARVSKPGNQGDLPFHDYPSVEIQPYETVLVGPCSKNAPGNFQVAGVTVQFLPSATTNPRLPGLPPESEEGFEIDLSSVKINAQTAVEGYFGNAGVFHAFRVQAPGTLFSNAPQISIQRATAKQHGNRWELGVRGFITRLHLPAGSPDQTVRVFQRVGGTPQHLKTVKVSLPPAGQTARWDFKLQLPPMATPPTTIFAAYNSAPGPILPEAELEVEIIAK
jgi:hypothetical protein